MNYRNIVDLNSDIKKWIPELPNDLDLIVGIPRSGLLVASLLALHLNLPLTDVEGLIKNRILQTGPRYGDAKRLELLKNKKVLIVDDSICSGSQMNQVRNKLEGVRLPHKIYYGAVYITPSVHKYVDFWQDIVDLPRVFEWNLMHHPVLANSCVDIDGVLCRDPIERENDDGENYQRFITNVKPLIVPTQTIGWLVTCRLEKYRPLTEEWLRKCKIRYEHLIMMDLPDKKTRVALGGHASFKAKIYKAVNAELFIESSSSQAEEIVALAGKPAFCGETGQMLNPNNFNNIKTKTIKFISEGKNNPYKISLKLVRSIKSKVLSLLLIKRIIKQNGRR